MASKNLETFNIEVPEVTTSDDVFKFEDLDQYALLDKLQDLPQEEFNKIKPEDLRYPWMLKSVQRKT